MRQFHLIPVGKKWRLSSEGPDPTLCDFDSRDDAVIRCGQLIGKEPARLKLYAENGMLLTEIAFLSGKPSAPPEKWGYDT